MKPKTIKRGSVVRVYQDPMTRKKPEGDAYVQRILAHDHLFIRVLVRFDDEDQLVERWIQKSDLVL